jgi:hypothetical protein
VIFIELSRGPHTLDTVMAKRGERAWGPAIRGAAARVLPAAIVVLVLTAAPGSAQEPRVGGFLRVQWHVTQLTEPTRTRLEGYVFNDSHVRITDVRLHVVERDGASRPVAEAWAWVFGDVPAGGSAYFVVPLPAAAERYDVAVVSFDPVSVEAP